MSSETIVVHQPGPVRLEGLPAPPDIDDILDAIEEPFGDTFDWLLCHPVLLGWMTSTTSHVLHLLGPPGSGKTVLSAFLFRSGLHQVSNYHPFFFTFQDRLDSSSASSAWSAFIFQLLAADPRLSYSVPAQTGAGGPNVPGSGSWREPQIKQTFERLTVAFRYPSIYIIDAMDQADDTLQKLLSSLTNVLKTNHSTPVKVLLVSRPGKRDLLTDLDEKPRHAESIDKFIKDKVDGLCRQRRGLQQCAAAITTQLSKTSRGMYLLPVMAVEKLKTIQATEENIDAALRRLPESLLDAYRTALDRVHPDNQPLTCECLLWVVFATRPLTIRELATAVTLRSDPPDAMTMRSSTSLDLVGDPGFTELQGPLLKVKEKGEEQIVSLTHHSAREFLLDLDQLSEDSDDSNRSAPPRWLLKGLYSQFATPQDRHVLRASEEYRSKAHQSIAEKQLRYLDILHASSKPVTRSDVLPDTRCKGLNSQAFSDVWNSRDLSMVDYCFDSLPDHVREVILQGVELHVQFANFLDGEVGKSWITRFWQLKDPGQDYGEQPAIHFAVALGLIDTVKSLLKKEDSTSHRDQRGNSVLDVAASTGDVEVLRLLIDGGADIHAVKDSTFFNLQFNHRSVDVDLRHGGTALHTAVWYGHRDATVYLLNSGAYIHGTDGQERTPLDIAVEARNKALVDILLQHDIEPSQIIKAIRRDRVASVKWLVEEHGVCQPDQDGDGVQNRLHVPVLRLLNSAVNCRSLHCLEYLVNSPMVLGNRDDEARGAFHRAAAADIIAVADFLLSRHLVNVNAVDEKH